MSPKSTPTFREHPVTCPDCGAPMRLRTAGKATGALKGRPFSGCSTYPRCKATHGAHPDGAPMGIPGDAATKAARIRAHAAFDSLWKGDGALMNRGAAYGWLEEALALSRGDGHIGRFTVEDCARLEAAVVAQRPLLVLRSRVRDALTLRFGGGKLAVAESRRWLAEALGEKEAFVRALDVDQCLRALAAIAPPAEPLSLIPRYPPRTQEQLAADMRGLAVLGPWRVIEINFRMLAGLTRFPDIWCQVCTEKYDRPDLVDKADEVHGQALAMRALATLFIGPDEDDDA